MIKTCLSTTIVALLLLGLTGCQTANTVPPTETQETEPTNLTVDPSTTKQNERSTTANEQTSLTPTAQASSSKSNTASTQTRETSIKTSTTTSKSPAKPLKTTVKTQTTSEKTKDRTQTETVKKRPPKKVITANATTTLNSTLKKTASSESPSKQATTPEKPVLTEHKNSITPSINSKQPSTNSDQPPAIGETASVNPPSQNAEEEPENTTPLSSEDNTDLQSTLAMVTPLPSPRNDLELEELPITFNRWTLELAQTASVSECLLRSKAVPIEDGQGSTTLVAQITEDAFILKTRSIIDTSYENTGIQIDQGQRIPIEQLHTEESVIYSSGYTRAMDLMKQGETLTVSLGFWPTWPITQAYEAKIDLTSFDQALESLRHCSLLLRQ
ncbi:hypothetical protein [Motiliproteus sp. MSK22-1]|uniref:hypothetical protein n=1 Tax=Motiliproteus sp. MSK22-1 TaxID=1897630 RepID=UPI000976243B|nr:hypothetical protein [Motiliproteus sp. MSK22-1]OMH38668.1 hypothetical protein BGP75_06400 [Motiliproteus sp. MSK22-1]